MAVIVWFACPPNSENEPGTKEKYFFSNTRKWIMEPWNLEHLDCLWMHFPYIVKAIQAKVNWICSLEYKSENVSVMAYFDISGVSTPAQEKLVWVNPQIVVMLAHESFAKISNPREGGNSTEGFIGPSWDFKGNPPTIQLARPSLSRQISLSTWSWPILLLLLLLSVKMI